ncbi:MAG: hypothetical protein WBA10_00925 [Elainellaceae cyanobacterium]
MGHFHLRQTGIAIFIGLVALLPACSSGISGLFDRARSPNNTTQLSDADLQNYLGQSINASGVIQSMVGDAAFIMEEKSIFTDKDLLVINAAKTPVSLPDQEDINLQVSGELKQLDIAEMEQIYGTTLDPRLRDYEGQPVIVADRITVESQPGDL